MKDKLTRLEFRKRRVRENISRAAHGLPRLCVRRSLKYFYAQIVDDAKGVTLVCADSRTPKSAACRKSVGDAKAVGKLIAEKALKAGVQQVVFDRGGLLYHGRIKALAEAAREAGLKF